MRALVKTLVGLLILLMLAAIALSQNARLEFVRNTGGTAPWKFAGMSEFHFTDFFGADTVVNGGHGIAVDRMNRIWIGSHFAGSVIYVLYPDGTPADFSPITSLTFETQSFPTTLCRGIGVDRDGNILFVRGSTPECRLFRIEPLFGSVTDIFGPTASLLSPMVDKNGFVWTGRVVGINPISVLDPLTLQEAQQINLTDGPSSWAGRGIAITADARTIITPDLGESGGPLYIWTTQNFLDYDKTDSIFTNTDDELILKAPRQTLNWHPQDSTLWVSVDLSDVVPVDNSKNGLYAFDFKKREYKFLQMPEIGPNIGNGPRGVAFSATGDTVYAIIWNGNRVARFVRSTDFVEERPVTRIPAAYELGQNYPNPFNPATTIPFSLSTRALVELKVYNSLGHEIATLVNNRVLPVGKYEVTFDGKGLASGLYHYQLYVDGQVLRKTMILLK